MEEADDKTNPVLERLKFVSIFSANLDEFFMVRVGSLFDVSLISPDETDNKTGMTSSEQLSRIYSVIPGLIKLKNQIYTSLCEDLDSVGIRDLSYDKLNSKEQKYIYKYFRTSVLPIISPIIIGPRHPVPHLVNKALYVTALLKDGKGKSSLGLVPITDALEPYVKIEDTDLSYIRMENIILQWISKLFGAYSVEQTCVISVTRNADISFDSDKFEDGEEDFRSRVMKLLKKRERLSAVRLEIDRKISDSFLSVILKTVNVEKRQIYFDSCPLNMKYVYKMIGDISQSKSAPLMYSPYCPRWPEDISQNYSIIEQIRRKDKLLFYPFDSVEPFIQLLNEAAQRDDVVSVKITIYRLASSSKIARALCRAAENGKEVIVLMELRARFDEANNISWSKLLEEAGCQVIYGIEDYKCHSKICLITMRNKNKMSYITQIGTGNYNEKTNKMYTDLSYITASQTIGEDATSFFRNMLINNLDGDYKELAVSPNGIKKTLSKLIDEQIAKGSDGYICIKANSITEREIIDKLKEASCSGVEVELIIRGICCILPSVPTYTEHISVTSIVGRYLEHARIYCFGRREDAKLYISSADLMTRNLNRRVEIACPIYDSEIRDQLLWILSNQLNDTAKASLMMPDGSYVRKFDNSPVPLESHKVFADLTLHKNTDFTPEKKGFIKRAVSRISKFFLTEKQG